MRLFTFFKSLIKANQEAKSLNWRRIVIPWFGSFVIIHLGNRGGFISKDKSNLSGRVITKLNGFAVSKEFFA